MEEAALLADTSEPKVPEKIMKKVSKLKEVFPIHWHVWHNDIEQLVKCLSNRDTDSQVGLLYKYKKKA